MCLCRGGVGGLSFLNLQLCHPCFSIACWGELRTEKWKQESFLLLNPQSMKGVHHDKDHHVFVISFGRLLSLGNHLAIMRPISSIWWCKFLCCTLVKTAAAAAARLVGIPPGENRRAFWRDQTLICGKSGCAGGSSEQRKSPCKCSLTSSATARVYDPTHFHSTLREDYLPVSTAHQIDHEGLCMSRRSKLPYPWH